MGVRFDGIYNGNQGHMKFKVIGHAQVLAEVL